MRRRTLALAAAVLLALGGCSGDDTAPTGGADDASAGPGETVSPAPSGDSTSSPGSEECSVLPTDDDDFAVGDAGTVTVRREGDRLVLGEVRPAEGWQHEVTSEQADEVEVEFTRGTEELDLDVEIEDGGVLEAEVCPGDG